ncbi:ANTAR domain-containing protein [Streptomyces venezuelae]|uniref:ANTAR domain-containing protein n=1 Tax=Streptomyces venezuelae TaxID=54571 RepID=UPI003451CB8A
MCAATAPGEEDMVLAQILADAAAAGLRKYLAVSAAERTERVQAALDDRIVIEQAKGVLFHRLGTGMDTAFTRLRDHARAHRTTLREVATRVAHGDLPAELCPRA